MNYAAAWAEINRKRQQQRQNARLRYEANALCNSLCHRLDWLPLGRPEERDRVMAVLERARRRCDRRAGR